MSAAERASTIVMGHVASTDPAVLRSYMQSGIGGFILMGPNIPATEPELQALTAALTVDPALPPLIAVDQEGGIVSRLAGDDYPASTSLKERPVADTSAAFAARGSLVARAGITVNFGTVADVTDDPSSFIHGRALGTDPAAAAERVAAATEAQEPFVASTLKHFPGHGAAAGDSHHAIPSTPLALDDWRRSDAVPFAAGIDAGASLLMYGHLAYTAVDPLPASLSPEWHRIAREELGFEGVAVTDDLGMLLSSGDPAYADPVANGIAAVAAGNDLVLMVAGSDAGTASDPATISTRSFPAATAAMPLATGSAYAGSPDDSSIPRSSVTATPSKPSSSLAIRCHSGDREAGSGSTAVYARWPYISREAPASIPAANGTASERRQSSSARGVLGIA